MSAKTTIYKVRVNLSDLDRNLFDGLHLTLALHPSETLERMMARLLAYCLNVQPGLVFTRGLSNVDEPDLWVRTLDDRTELWIEVGEPAPDRIKKAVRMAKRVRVYSFNSKSEVWWQQQSAKIGALNVDVLRFDLPGIQALAGLIRRNLELSMTISGNTAFISSETGDVEVNWQSLKGVD